MFSQDRQQLRAVYQDSWRKHLNRQPLTPLEAQVVQVMREHPEYLDAILAENATDRDWSIVMGQTNPFLHLGMHLAIREQVATNRPQGIADCFSALCWRTGNPLEAEHLMMDCLAEALWQAQRQHCPPDEQAYLACLQRLSHPHHH